MLVSRRNRTFGRWRQFDTEDDGVTFFEATQDLHLYTVGHAQLDFTLFYIAVFTYHFDSASTGYATRALLGKATAGCCLLYTSDAADE